MPQLTDLLKQREALDAQIADLQHQDRQQALASIKQLMLDNDLTLADLVAESSLKLHKSLAPKYRDARTGQTWSERGLQPRWLRAAIHAGASLEQFAV